MGLMAALARPIPCCCRRAATACAMDSAGSRDKRNCEPPANSRHKPNSIPAARTPSPKKSALYEVVISQLLITIASTRTRQCDGANSSKSSGGSSIARNAACLRAAQHVHAVMNPCARRAPGHAASHCTAPVPVEPAACVTELVRHGMRRRIAGCRVLGTPRCAVDVTWAGGVGAARARCAPRGTGA